MLKNKKHQIIAALIALGVLVVAGTVAAVVPAVRVNGVQITPLVTDTIQATKQGVWVDNTNKLRYDDGTTSNYVPYSASSQTGPFLPLAGGTMTGDITVNNSATALQSPSSQTLSMKSGQSNGTTPAYVFDTANAFAGVANPILQLKTAGAALLNVSTTGTDIHLAGLTGIVAFQNSAGDGITTAAGQINFAIGGSTQAQIGNNTFYGTTDNVLSVGYSGSRNKLVYAYQYGGVTQTIANAATVTVNPTLGETIRFTLGATAETANFSAGIEGQKITIEVIQDATGGRSFTFGTGIKIAGGAYTPTATATKRDVFTAVYNTTDALFHETSRAMNL